MTRRKGLVAVFGLILSLAAPVARGEVIGDTAPAGSLVYVSFKGSEHLGGAYEASHLKPVLEASGFGRFYHELVPQLLQQAMGKDDEGARTLADGLTAFEILGRHGFALHLLTVSEDGVPSGGLTCDAGEEADKLEKAIGALAPAGGGAGPAFVVRRAGTRVTVRVGGAAAGGGGAEDQRRLSASPEFRSVLKQVDADPVFLAYVDFERAFALADGRLGGTPWAGIKSAAGLGGLKRYVITGSFAGRDWSTASFTEAPAPRTGWLKILHAPDGMPRALVGRIPGDATSANVTHLDLAGWVKGIRDVVGAAGGANGERQFDQALGLANLYVGRNILTDVLGPLGSDWVIYASPSVVHGADQRLYSVVVNKVVDEARARDGLTSLTYALANTSHIPQAKAFGLSAMAGDVEIGGLKITHLTFEKPLPNLPRGFSPAWAIKDGMLYVGASPEAVAAAANYNGPTLADGASFVALRDRLGAPAGSAFEFTDAAATVPATYPAIRSLADMGRAALSAQGLKTSANPLPSLAAITPELGTILSASWTDAAGFHSKSTSPFPGSSFLAGGSMTTVGTAALATSIVLPSLNRARETANRVKCASNMKQIGTAIFLYANEHQFQYPPDLGTLVITQEITDDAFVCPDSDTKVVDPTGLTMEQLRARVSAETDYSYVGQGLRVDSDADALVLYENVKNHEDGMNMLFSDGSVEFVLRDEAARIIAAKRRTPRGGNR